MFRRCGEFARTFARAGKACCAALALSACATVSGETGGGPQAGPSVPPSLAGEVIGTGNVQVAMLVPRSAGGNGAATAAAFRNAAELAVKDYPGAGIQVSLYDTQGSSAGAQAAIGLALAEGADLVLGPVFSAEVAAVAPQARQAGVPVVAFSSDAGVAAPGVYLLTFLPSDDIERIVSYAAEQGRRSYAALLPASAYGAVVEGAFRRTVAAQGGRILSIQTYADDPADMQAKAGAIAGVAAQIDALLIPDPKVLPALTAALGNAGITREKVRLLGSGQWDDPAILNNQALVGSWFPAPSRQGFETFSPRYQAAYGAVPPRNATLAYDATVLAAGLARQAGAEPINAQMLANPSGFRGLDGTFRFLPSGVSERRLAVYEVTGSGARIVAPAAGSFDAGS